MNHFLRKIKLSDIPLIHTKYAYHIFLSDGNYDIEIGLLIKSNDATDILKNIICRSERLLIDSHHGLIIFLCHLSKSLKWSTQ